MYLIADIRCVIFNYCTRVTGGCCAEIFQWVDNTENIFHYRQLNNAALKVNIWPKSTNFAALKIIAEQKYTSYINWARCFMNCWREPSDFSWMINYSVNSKCSDFHIVVSATKQFKYATEQTQSSSDRASNIKSVLGARTECGWINILFSLLHHVPAGKHCALLCATTLLPSVLAACWNCET